MAEARGIDMAEDADQYTRRHNRFSSFGKLRRVIAYCLRTKPTITHKGVVGIEELKAAENKIIKLVQMAAFHDDMKKIKSQRQVHNKSKLKSLDPFLDEVGILRVGGSLKNAQLPYEQQHPAILPKSHHVTDIIIEHFHHQNYHSGVQATFYAIRRKYWLIDGRSQIRKIIRRCIPCFRANRPTMGYPMGN